MTSFIIRFDLIVVTCFVITHTGIVGVWISILTKQYVQNKTQKTNIAIVIASTCLLRIVKRLSLAVMDVTKYSNYEWSISLTYCFYIVWIVERIRRINFNECWIALDSTASNHREFLLKCKIIAFFSAGTMKREFKLVRPVNQRTFGKYNYFVQQINCHGK